MYECDHEVIRYAHKRQCFAILGQDSDFIIPNIESVVLLAKHFDLETMTTVLCDRQKFASISLGLYIEELPLFATILGNDFVPWEEVKVNFQ